MQCPAARPPLTSVHEVAAGVHDTGVPQAAWSGALYPWHPKVRAPALLRRAGCATAGLRARAADGVGRGARGTGHRQDGESHAALPCPPGLCSGLPATPRGTCSPRRSVSRAKWSFHPRRFVLPACCFSLSGRRAVRGARAGGEAYAHAQPDAAASGDARVDRLAVPHQHDHGKHASGKCAVQCLARPRTPLAHHTPISTCVWRT